MLHNFGAPRRLLWFFLGALAVVALAGTAIAGSAKPTASSSPTTPVGGLPAATGTVVDMGAGTAFRAVYAGTVDPATIPQETAAAAQAKAGQQIPLLHPMGAARYAAAKRAALAGMGVPSPGGTQLGATAGVSPGAAAKVAATTALDPGGVLTPGVKAAFPGMADSGSICKFFGGGCQPSDMGLAASGHNIVQAVNTSIAVYSPTGSLRAGFPKDLQAFLGVRNPSPAGCATGNGPFLSDPRLAYDPNDHRFFLTTLEVEGAFGVNSGCTKVTRVWIAVSSGSNPAGSWFVYNIAWNFGDPNRTGDFDMLGFDQQALYVSGDMFDTPGNNFLGSTIFSLDKAAMEAGASAGGFFFTNLSAGGNLVSEVQPVESLNRSGGPNTEYLVSSWAGGSNNVVLWSFANPLGHQSSGPRLTGLAIGTASYAVPPNADNAGACTNCVDTNDSRVSATPVYHDGRVLWALPTAINNGTTTVSGALWGVFRPRLDQGVGACTLCVGLTGNSSLEEQGYYFYGSRGFVYFPSVMTDDEGNFEMLFNYSGNGFAPSVAYALKRVSADPGVIPGSGLFLIASTTPTGDSRWGDYSAESWTGPDNNTLWMAGEYSNGDWATEIGQVGLPITATLGNSGD